MSINRKDKLIKKNLSLKKQHLIKRKNTGIPRKTKDVKRVNYEHRVVQEN